MMKIYLLRRVSRLLALRDATDSSPNRRYWGYSGRAVIAPYRSFLTHLGVRQEAGKE
jgi:hypothetical protein